MSAVMASITVNKCAITHMEHTTVSVMMVMNFKVMGSHVEVEQSYYYASHVRIIIAVADFIDINECSTGVDQCEQACQNTNGSYTCACRDGFRLKSAGLQCEGMVYDRLNYLSIQ